MSSRFEAMAGCIIMMGGKPVEFLPESTTTRLAQEASVIPPLETLLPRDVFLLDGDGLVTDKRHGYVTTVGSETVVPVEQHLEAETGKLLPWPRGYRQRLFDAAQWTQAGPVRAAKGKEWAVAWDTYLQALRDLPETCPEAARVDWPTPPA